MDSCEHSVLAVVEHLDCYVKMQGRWHCFYCFYCV